MEPLEERKVNLSDITHCTLFYTQMLKNHLTYENEIGPIVAVDNNFLYVAVFRQIRTAMLNDSISAII